jgi:hypothetical protein
LVDAVLVDTLKVGLYQPRVAKAGVENDFKGLVAKHYRAYIFLRKQIVKRLDGDGTSIISAAGLGPTEESLGVCLAFRL